MMRKLGSSRVEMCVYARMYVHMCGVCTCVVCVCVCELQSPIHWLRTAGLPRLTPTSATSERFCHCGRLAVQNGSLWTFGQISSVGVPWDE